MKKVYSKSLIFYFYDLCSIFISILVIIASLVRKESDILILLVFAIPSIIFYFLHKHVGLIFYDDSNEFMYQRLFSKSKYNKLDVDKIKIDGYSIYFGLADVYIFFNKSRFIRLDSNKELVKELLVHFPDVNILCNGNIEREIKKLRND